MIVLKIVVVVVVVVIGTMVNMLIQIMTSAE